MMKNIKLLLHSNIAFMRGKKRRMQKSRFVSLVIITAVVVFVFTVFVFQMAAVITGIQGTNFIFTFGMATFISLTFLLFEGNRLGFFFHNTLAMLLTLPTSFGGTPYDILPRLVIILAGFPADLILNSLYKVFKKNDRLVWWSILTTIFFIPLVNIFQVSLFPLYFPSEFVTTYTNILIIMSPWIIGGSIVGGVLGYKLYRRVEHIR